jgi:hypothetical protein
MKKKMKIWIIRLMLEINFIYMTFKIETKDSNLFNSLVNGGIETKLPISIETFYNNIYVKIFRFIGFVANTLVMTKYYLFLPELLHRSVLILAGLFIAQLFIVLLIKLYNDFFKSDRK